MKRCPLFLCPKLNKEERDYSTVDEIAHMEELSDYSYEAICTAVYGLKNRVEVKKPYGYVYAVNKLRIPNMMFDYS